MSIEFIDFLKEQLAPLGHISHKRMFGSYCLFIHGQMFAIIDKDEQIFIKTPYIAPNDTPFCYERQGKSINLHYIKIDTGLIDDSDELLSTIQAILNRPMP